MIIGHKKQWQFLKGLAESDKIPHAFLFTGLEKLGKKTLAFEFIKLLNCEKPSGERPCQVCPSCQSIRKIIHPDLIFIEPADGEIPISKIRDLGWKLSLKNSVSKYKAAIIDKAHTLNQEAQNCFLKTLEEPRGNAVIILITEHPGSLFPTVLSRVQEIKFYPLGESEINEYLKTRGLAESNRQEIIKFCQGRPGLATDFADFPEKLKSQKEKIKEIAELSKNDLAFRFQYAKKMAEEPQNFREIFNIWMNYFRDIMIARILKKEDSAALYTPAKLKNILAAIQKIDFLTSTTNISPRLALEALMLEF